VDTAFAQPLYLPSRHATLSACHDCLRWVRVCSTTPMTGCANVPQSVKNYLLDKFAEPCRHPAAPARMPFQLPVWAPSSNCRCSTFQCTGGAMQLRLCKGMADTLAASLPPSSAERGVPATPLMSHKPRWSLPFRMDLRPQCYVHCRRAGASSSPMWWPSAGAASLT
jgi:hypothetical protein